MTTPGNRAPSEEGEIPDASSPHDKDVSGDTMPSADSSGSSQEDTASATAEADGGGHSGSFRGIGTGSVRDGRGGRDAPVEDTQSDGGDDRGDPEARHGRDRGRSRDRDGEPGRVGSGGGGGSGPGGMFPIRFDSRNGGAYRIPDGVGMGGMGGRVGRRGPMSGTRWTGGMRGGGGPGLGRGGRWMGGGGGVGGRGGNFVGFQNYADLAVRPGGFGGGGRGGVGGSPGPGGMGGGGFGGGVIGGRGYAELAASRGSDERRRNSGDDERRRGSGFGGGSGSGDEDDRRRRSHSGGSATSGRRSSGLSINGRSSPSPGAGSDRAGGRGNKSPFGSHDLEGDGVGEHGRRVVGWGERDRDRERRGDRDRATPREPRENRPGERDRDRDRPRQGGDGAGGEKRDSMTERSRDYRRDAPIPSAAQGSSGGGPLLATVPPSLGRRESATGAKDYGREAWDNRPPSLRISGGVSAAWGDAREREWDREWDRDRSRDRSGDRSGDRSRDRNRERDRDRGRGNRGRGSTSPLTRGSSPLSIAAAAASLDAHAHTGGRFDGGGDGDIGSTRVSTGAFRYDHEHDVEASEVPPPPPTRRAVSAGGGDTHPPAYTQQRRFSSSGYAPVHRRDNNSGASGRSTETAKGVSGVVRGGISGAEVPEANRSGFDGRAAVAGRSVSSGPTLRVTNPDAFKGVDADGESGGGVDELALFGRG
ncbi:unnamed protein product [Ascophyllum nodosum]